MRVTVSFASAYDAIAFYDALMERLDRDGATSLHIPAITAAAEPAHG